MPIRDVKEFIKPYVALSRPIPYHSLYIYPIKVEDYESFYSNVGILTIEKNRIPDVKILSMNYLQFLVDVAFVDKTEIVEGFTIGAYNITKFYNILSLIFKVEIKDIVIDYDEHMKYCINIKGDKITYLEFDEIRKIVLYQNILDYDDRELSEDMRQVIEDYYSLKNKNMKPITLEDKVTVVMLEGGYEEEQIANMTYRRLCMIFNKAISKIEYIVGLYGYNRSEAPEHWVYQAEKDKYADIFIDAQTYVNKINSVNG